MSLRPDFEHCATGYRWLDRLTAPWWRRRSRAAERHLWESLAIGDEDWTEVRDRVQRYVRQTSS